MGRVNEADLEWTETERGATRFRRKRLAAAAGGDAVGASLYELPPGARSWPYHYHTGNEEALFVLAGEGRLRSDDGEEPEGARGDRAANGGSREERLAAGDYVALPAGPEGAHRVVNDGDEPLRYLAVSTMREPDVTVYPDSDKVGVFAGSPPGGDGERTVHGYYPADADVSYWEGEE